MKYNSETNSAQSTFEETSVGFSPTNSSFESIFLIFCFYRRYEILERSTISLGIVCGFLLTCCMMACVCCLKKRGEVYILRNRQGIDNRHAHLRNSDENIPESTAERGLYLPEEQRRIFNKLQEWSAELRANHERATQAQRFAQYIELRNRNIANVELPPPHPHVHAQNLDNTHVENEML